MRITVHSFTDNGIDSVTAHNWVNTISRKIAPKTIQVIRPVILRGAVCDTVMHVRSFIPEQLLMLTKDMMESNVPNINIDKWKCIKTIIESIIKKENKYHLEALILQ